MCLVTAGGQGSLLLSHWSIHHPLHLTRTTISSFHIWVSFRSQNPIWSHHPWTTPPFINNKSFPIYSHQKIFPYLSLSFFFFFFYRVKHANHNSAHQLALSPATQTPHMYLPRGGLPTSLTPPFTHYNHLSSIHYSTRQPPQLSLTLPTTHHHISSIITLVFKK